MNEPIYTETYKGHYIKIYRDDDAESPRSWDNAGTMVCWHNRYNLGDKNGHDFARDVPEEAGVEVNDSPEGLEAYLKDHKAISLPLYLYDHGGVTMKCGPFGDPWDSGQVGYIYILPETIRKEWGKGKHAYAQARKCLEAEVKAYDDYLTGEVFGYIIDDGEGDSCWGFYPDTDDKHPEGYCLREARAVVDGIIQNSKKKGVK